MSPSITDVRHFRSLAEAVDFIATCLDANSPADLFAQVAFPAERYRHVVPDHLSHFAAWVFPPLLAEHRKHDLRSLYAGRDFPEAASALTLGGHFAEIGCMHTEFVKSPDGWALSDIWQCR